MQQKISLPIELNSWKITMNLMADCRQKKSAVITLIQQGKLRLNEFQQLYLNKQKTIKSTRFLVLSMYIF